MVPKTGMASLLSPAAEWLRAHCRQTDRRASSAPRRSNLLMATTSARSSMSIFSSWEAAPNCGVALSDPGRLDNDEVVAGGAARADDLGYELRYLRGAAAGGQRAKEDLR